jgi:PI-3-kinase-related kinase SMG-1
MSHLLLKSFTDCNTISHNGVYVIPPVDAVIGQLLQLGVSRCPELGKAWSQFASWCYRWGRRVVDAASEAGGQLSEVDRVAVQQMMPPGISADDLDKVYFILSQTRAVADDEDIEVRLVMFTDYEVATQAVLFIIRSSLHMLDSL